MKSSLLLFFVLAASLMAVVAFPEVERFKRSLHRQKLKVKIVATGPLGFKHRYRYKDHNINYGGGFGGGFGLGHYGNGNFGHHGGHYGWNRFGGNKAYASSFSSPLVSYASAGAISGR